MAKTSSEYKTDKSSLYQNKNSALQGFYTIDLNSIQYKKVSEAIENIVKDSVSYTSRDKAIEIFQNFLANYTFKSDSFENWMSSVDQFVDECAKAIKDGYLSFPGTTEDADLDGLSMKIAISLSPGFKGQTTVRRESKYDDTTIRSVQNFYDPSGNTQEQVSTVVASQVAVGMSSVEGADKKVTVSNAANGTYDTRASVTDLVKSVLGNVQSSTAPDAYVCIADEIYDASGAKNDEATEALQAARDAYAEQQQSLGSMDIYSMMSTPVEVEEAGGYYDAINNVCTSMVPFTKDDLKTDVLIPVSDTCRVSSSDMCLAEEPKDLKDVKEHTDDVLNHDDGVGIDTMNMDSVEGEWALDRGRFDELLSDKKTEIEKMWRVSLDRDPIRLANYGQTPSDPLDNTKNATYYEYGLKIVELPPVGVDMASFGEAQEFRVYSRIDTVGSFASNANIQNPVPPAGQNAMGFYYTNHNARSLSLSFTLHQQEYPDTPLMHIANILQNFSRPYQYPDLHVEPKRCQIYLPGMTFEGYISTVQCSFKGDLYTTWNDELPQPASGSLQNTTSEQYSYGQLECSISFLIDENITLKQVKSDEKYALKYEELPAAEQAEVILLTDAVEQIELPGNPDKNLLKSLFASVADFRIADMQEVREWIKKIKKMISDNVDKIYTLDADLSTMTDSEMNDLQRYYLADKRSEGTLSFLIMFEAALEYSYTFRSGYKTIEGVVFGESGGEKNFSDERLLTDPGLWDSHYDFKEVFSTNYEKFKNVYPLRNDYVDTTDSSWFTFGNLVKMAALTTAFAICPVAAIATAAIVGAATVVVAAVNAIKETLTETVYFFYRLFGVSDRSDQFPYDYFMKTLSILQGDKTLWGFLEELKDIRPYFQKIKLDFFKTNKFERLLNETKITLAEKTPIFENGCLATKFNDKPLLVYPHLQFLTLAFKAIGRGLCEALNNSGTDLSSKAINSAITSVQNAATYGTDGDHVKEIHEKTTNNGEDKYFANVVYLFRLMQCAYLTIVDNGNSGASISFDFNAMDIPNATEMDERYRELKSRLSRWHDLVFERHFEFNLGTFVTFYNYENKDIDGTDFWSKLEKSLDWVMVAEGSKKTDYDMKFRNLLTKTDSGWYEPGELKLVTEGPVDWETDDFIMIVKFDWWLESTVTNLHHNGNLGSYTDGALKADRVSALPKNNPAKSRWSNTRIVNGKNSSFESDKNVVDEDLSLANSVDKDHIKDVKEADYAIAVCLSDGWYEQGRSGSDRHWLDDYWEHPEDDNYASRDYVHETLAMYDDFMDKLKNLKAVSRDTQVSNELHRQMVLLSIITTDSSGKETCWSAKSIQETIYGNAVKAINIFRNIGMTTASYDVMRTQRVGLLNTDKVIDTLMSPSDELKILWGSLTWGDVYGTVNTTPPTDREKGWINKVLMKNGETGFYVAQGFPRSESHFIETDDLVARVIGWFYGDNKQKTVVAERFETNGWAYPSL